MPTKDKEPKEQEEKEPSKHAAEDVPAETVAAKRSVQGTPPWPLITIGVVATVVIVAVMIGGWLFIVGHERSSTGRAGQLGTLYGQNSSSQNGSYFGGGGRYRRGALQQTAANGVVTAVNGQTLTVSGQGKQVTVTETSSTTVSGDATSVAVNDTVLVYGTTNSDGSVTATRIIVRNGAAASGASTDSLQDQTVVPGA